MSGCRQLPGTTNQRLLLLFLLLAGNALPSEGRASVNAREIRLVNGSDSCSGRVEVLHDRQWGTVCDDSWDLQDATVVCRQLGCGAAREATRTARFGSGTGRIWRDEVRCTGAESSLSQCPADPWGVNDCSHGEDAGVVCSGAAREIRLVNGSDSCSGRVELLHDGQWGTVCDDLWDIEDAKVVCRQMGCGAAREARGSARFGRGTGPIWQDDVRCTGGESSLSQCPARPWGENNCNHGEDAGVVCAGHDLSKFIKGGSKEHSVAGAAREIRLVNGSDSCSGRVEMLHDDQWGTICDDNWDLQDARVVCRQMGCGAAREATRTARFGRGTGCIWRDEVRCTGAESSLSQCPADPWGVNDCSHGEDAGVVCSGRTWIHDDDRGPLGPAPAALIENPVPNDGPMELRLEGSTD